MPNKEMRFEKFQTSSQAPVKLKLALEGFFREDTPQDMLEAYEAYLKQRIRPALEALIAADDLPKLERLEAMGWLNAALTEDALGMAIRWKKTEIFLWLLNQKADKYGFSDRDFSL